jgi:7-carboxy-7-deazaguanine synthase
MTLVKEKEQHVSVQYPIAETFTSPQGEGVYSGMVMTFIRLAGCTVGKPYDKKLYEKLLPVYTEQCKLYDGRTFACDTDYRVHERLTSEQIIERIPSEVEDVCITGGEPLMHDISQLITHLHGLGRKIHIETSGTLYRDLVKDIWVTVSPKRGVDPTMMGRGNEFKILVDENFNPKVLVGGMPLLSLAYSKPVFLQPVNYETTINKTNLKLCMDWQKKYPQFRVSVQLHKIISHFLNEEVR